MEIRDHTCKLLVNGAKLRFGVSFPADRGADIAESGNRDIDCAGHDEDVQIIREVVRRGREQTGLPPLVLIHGFPLNNLVWDRVNELVAREVLTIRPNLRGFGQLSNVDAFSIASLAEDLHELLREIAALPCVLAGLSMGGYVALAFARNHPDALDGLALVSSRATADSEQQKQNRLKMIDNLHRNGTAGVVDDMLPNLVAPATLERDPAVIEELQRIMLDTAPPTIEHACLAMRDREDLTGVATALQAPSAIIVGEADKLGSVTEAKQLAESMKACSLHLVPDAGHITPLEQPRSVAEALMELMRRVAAQKSSRRPRT